MSKRIYNHAFTVAFELRSFNNSDNVTKEELISALLQRTSNLVQSWEPDAFDCFDTFIEETEESDA